MRGRAGGGALPDNPVGLGLVLVAALALLAFSLANPEGLVARENVERFERTGKIDTRYLRTLGADATPALARLPEPTHERATLAVPASDGIFALNLARIRARAASD